MADQSNWKTHLIGSFLIWEIPLLKLLLFPMFFSFYQLPTSGHQLNHTTINPLVLGKFYIRC